VIGHGMFWLFARETKNLIRGVGAESALVMVTPRQMKLPPSILHSARQL
jgi:hypothetical protein